LSDWASDVMVGSSGAAMIGMQFVVITLLAERSEGAADRPTEAKAWGARRGLFGTISATGSPVPRSRS
jgi:hypothetical protein